MSLLSIYYYKEGGRIQMELYNGKDLKDALNMTDSAFKRRTEKIKRVFNLDINDFRNVEDDSDTKSNANLRFSKTEFEILKLLLKNIDKFPLPTGESTFYYKENREKALRSNPAKFVEYMKEFLMTIDDNSPINTKDYPIKSYIYSTDVYHETMEWITAQDKLSESMQRFFEHTSDLSLLDSAFFNRQLARRIDEMTFELQHHNSENIEKFLNNLSNTIIIKESPPEEVFNKVTNQLIDIHLVEELKQSIQEKNSILKEISKEQTETALNNELSDDKKEIHNKKLEAEKKLFTFYDPLTDKIENHYIENFITIENAVDYYKTLHFEHKDFIFNITDIKNNMVNLYNDSKFKEGLHNLMKDIRKYRFFTNVYSNNTTLNSTDKNILQQIMIDLENMENTLVKYAIPNESINQPMTEAINDYMQIHKKTADSDNYSNSIAQILSKSYANDVYDRLDSYHEIE